MNRALSPEELTYLERAGQWKLLRALHGHIVCMSGKMSMERSQLALLVKSAGGLFTNSMSGAVTLLVVADDTVWTQKLEQAEARGTRVVRESEFAAELLPTADELLTGHQARFGDPR